MGTAPKTVRSTPGPGAARPVAVRLRAAADARSLEENDIEVAKKKRLYDLLVSRTVDVFGDEVKASYWLSQPNDALMGETPLQVAQQDGYDSGRIEPILSRIEHGIYY